MQMETVTAIYYSEPIKVGDYVLKSVLGEGSFSTIWKAEHRLSGQVVALKRVYLSRLNRHLRSCLDCELNFLSSVNHPNIIRLFEVFEAIACHAQCGKKAKEIVRAPAIEGSEPFNETDSLHKKLNELHVPSLTHTF